MHISTGSRGLSRNGGNIHVHLDIPFITIQSRIKTHNSQSISPAPLEIRDAVFRKLIRISPASNYMEELVTGPGGLLSRGLLKDHATSYGALPRTKRQRAVLAGILNDYVRDHFPQYAKSHSGAGVVGVPGFWRDFTKEREQGPSYQWTPDTSRAHRRCRNHAEATLSSSQSTVYGTPYGHDASTDPFALYMERAGMINGTRFAHDYLSVRQFIDIVNEE